MYNRYDNINKFITDIDKLKWISTELFIYLRKMIMIFLFVLMNRWSV